MPKRKDLSSEAAAAEPGVPRDLLRALARTWHEATEATFPGGVAASAHAPALLDAAAAEAAAAAAAGDGSPLLAAAEASAPRWLRERAANPLRISVRRAASSGRGPSLELQVDGVFRAVVEVVALAAGPAADAGCCWVPHQLALGPSGAAMALGAAEPPELEVFREATEQGGAVLGELEGAPVAERLPHLVRWLCSLHDLFQAKCAVCQRALAPATAAGGGAGAGRTPPTARVGRELVPCHPSCYRARHGRPPGVFVN